jgi:hypothetical protein
MANDWQPKSALAHAVDTAGFWYDPVQDILFSKMNAWQSKTGFCSMYDETSPAVISAIIDCEPVRFKYNHKEWMIELWKGQYGLETGAEIGVYNLGTPKPVPLPKLEQLAKHLPERFANPFIAKARAADKAAQAAADKTATVVRSDWLACAEIDDRLTMSFTLYKNGQPLFHRGPEQHWWLTGFKWGMVSETTDLKAKVEIECKDAAMRDAFVEALTRLGYRDVETREKFTVGFTFDTPKSVQPESRALAQATVQSDNATLVATYNHIKETNHLKTNDPNGIPDSAAGPLIAYFKSFLALKAAFKTISDE